MNDIKRVPSSVFRLTYVREQEPVAVTVLGRVIGHYVPASVAIDDRFIAGLRPGEPASPPGQESVASGPAAGDAPGRPEAPDSARGTAPRMTQADKDKVLRRVAGGKI